MRGGYCQALAERRRVLKDSFGKDFSVGEVASRAGVCHATISQWESGYASPSTMARAKSWARAVNARLRVVVKT